MWGFLLQSVVCEYHAVIVTEREYPGTHMVADHPNMKVLKT